MTLRTTGFDSAPSIPEGAKLSRISWQVTGHYGDGPTFASLEDALAEGLIEARRRELPGLTIDLRWKLVFPGGGGLEATAQRYEYAGLDAAQRHLDRIRCYATDARR